MRVFASVVFCEDVRSPGTSYLALLPTQACSHGNSLAVTGGFGAFLLFSFPLVLFLLVRLPK